MKIETADLKRSLEKLKSARAGLDELRTREELNSAEVNAMSLAIDLDNGEAVSTLTQRRTIAAVLPARIEAAQGKREEAEKGLLTACHVFVSGNLGPALREAGVKIRKLARRELSAHFTDEHALSRAVDGSAVVREVDSLLSKAAIRNNVDAGVYAEELLRAAAQAEQLSAKL